MPGDETRGPVKIGRSPSVSICSEVFSRACFPAFPHLGFRYITHQDGWRPGPRRNIRGTKSTGSLEAEEDPDF